MFLQCDFYTPPIRRWYLLLVLESGWGLTTTEGTLWIARPIPTSSASCPWEASSWTQCLGVRSPNSPRETRVQWEWSCSSQAWLGSSQQSESTRWVNHPHTGTQASGKDPQLVLCRVEMRWSLKSAHTVAFMCKFKNHHLKPLRFGDCFMQPLAIRTGA